MANISARKMADLKRRMAKTERSLRIKRIRKRGWYVLYWSEAEGYWIEHDDPENRYRQIRTPITREEAQRQAAAAKQELLLVQYVVHDED